MKKLFYFNPNKENIDELKRGVAFLRKIHQKNEIYLTYDGIIPDSFKFPKQITIIDIGSKEKEEKIKKTLDKFIEIRPDFLIVPEHPFCKSNYAKEIDFLINKAKDIDCDIICNLSGLNPIITSEENMKNIDNFQKIFINTDQSVKRLYESDNKKLNNKLFFTDFLTKRKKKTLCNKNSIRKALRLKDEEIILVSGGEGRNSFETLKKIIEYYKKTPNKYLLLISTGPSMPQQEYNKIKELSKDKNIKVVRTNPSIFDYINAADIVISVEDYNIVAESIACKKSPLIISTNNSKSPLLETLDKEGYLSFIKLEDLHYNSFRNYIIKTRIKKEFFKKQNTTLNGYNPKYELRVKGSEIIARYFHLTGSLTDMPLSLLGKCNLNCMMCCDEKGPKFDRKEFLTYEQIVGLVKEAKKFGLKNAPMAGGEPTLHPELIKICEFFRKEKLPISFNTNGQLIKHEFIDFLCRREINTAINFSLDSSIPELHDKIRGKIGTFDTLIKNAKKILEKRQSKYSPRLFFACVVMKPNLKDLPNLVKMAKEMGVDGVTFQVLQAYGGKYKDNKILIDKDSRNFEKLWIGPEDYELLDKTIDELIKLKKEGYAIVQSIPELQTFKRYFRYPKEKLEIVCRTGGSVLCISSYGDYKPCWGVDWRMGEINDMSLTDAWLSRKHIDFISKMKDCRLPCIVNCLKYDF